MTPYQGTVEVFKSELSGEWYFRLIGRNGEKLAASEGHKNRIDVLDVVNRYFTKGWTVKGGVDDSSRSEG